MKIVRFLLLAMIAGVCMFSCKAPVQKVDKYAIDCSQIRGFNYTPATVKDPRHHVDTWVAYDPAEARQRP